MRTEKSSKEHLHGEPIFEIPEGMEQVFRPPIGTPSAPAYVPPDDKLSSGAIASTTLGLQTDIEASQMSGNVPVFRIQQPTPAGDATNNSSNDSSLLRSNAFLAVQGQTADNATAIAALQHQTFQGTWVVSVSYSQSAIVEYNDLLYVSLVNNNLGNEPDISPTDWMVTGSVAWQGTWSSSTTYAEGAIVEYSGTIYISLQGANLNNTPSSSPLFWQATGSVAWQGAWSSLTTYALGAFVSYSGLVYVSLAGSNLNNTPSSSPTFWQSTGGVSTFLGNWNNSTAYVIGNQVIDAAGGGGYYIAIANNTNEQPSANPADWQLITAGNLNSFAGNYSGATSYTVGQVVEYQGSQWVCVSATTGNAPSTTSAFWTLLGSNALFMGTWNSGTAYTQNMIVVYQGNLYQAVQASTNQTPSPSSSTYWQLTGPATLDNLEDGTIYIRGIQYQSQTMVVPNSNFEASSSLPVPGWFGSSATLSYETSSPYAGNQSLKVAASVQFGSAASIQKWACSPGDQFFVSAAMKSDGTGIPDTQLIFVDKTGSYVGGVQAAGSTSTSWSVVTGTGAAPANSVACYLSLQNNTALGAGVCWFDNISVDKIYTLGSTVVNGPANFSAVASGLSYRPTTNPLTATDAGSNATVSIASFTMQTSGNGAISVSSGSITALSYGTLYYIYYSDPTLAGGAVTFLATTSKATAINGNGNFYVGSITTPISGGIQTTGFGDGGVGAQNGGATIYLGALTTVTTTGAGGTVTNPNNAIDGNITTFADVKTNFSSSASENAKLLITGFPPIQVLTGATLYIRSSGSCSFSGSGTTGDAEVDYSLNGGGSLNLVYALNTNGSSHSLDTQTITLPIGQNLALVQVEAFTSGSITVSGSVTTEIKLYEAWIEVIN